MVIDYISQGENKPSFDEWKLNPTLRNIWHNYDRLFLHNDLLVRSRTMHSPHPNYALVIPNSLVDKILQGVHDSPFCGHLGITRTEAQIRERFYWPGIRNSVVNHIKHCTVCQARNSPTNLSKAPMQTIDVGEPFSFWALDYMGPIAETSRGNKWCEAFPTKDQNASTAAQTLISKVFSRFGPPVVLHSDQGAKFESTLMHEICDIMGIAKTRTTAYHPRGDGQCERQNRTLQDMLAAFVSSRRDDWDLWLDAWTPLCTRTILVARNPLGLARTNWSLGSYLVCPLNPNWVSPLQAPPHTQNTHKLPA